MMSRSKNCISANAKHFNFQIFLVSRAFIISHKRQFNVVLCLFFIKLHAVQFYSKSVAENDGRLKKLEYLDSALNNMERLKCYFHTVTTESNRG